MNVKIKLSKDFAKALENSDFSTLHLYEFTKLIDGFGTLMEPVDGKSCTFDLKMPQGHEQQVFDGMKDYLEDLKVRGGIKKIDVKP